LTPLYGDVAEPLLDAQLVRINAHLDLAELGPEIVDTFDANGEFRWLEDIASELVRKSQLSIEPEAPTLVSSCR
jgi:hypothetical protein